MPEAGQRAGQGSLWASPDVLELILVEDHGGVSWEGRCELGVSTVHRGKGKRLMSRSKPGLSWARQAERVGSNCPLGWEEEESEVAGQAGLLGVLGAMLHGM